MRKPSKSVYHLRREPILGDGAGPFLGELAIIAGGFGLMILALFAAIYLKGLAYNFLYGEPTAIHGSVPAGNYQWTPEGGLKRLN